MNLKIQLQYLDQMGIVDIIANHIPSHKINIFGKNSLMFNTLPYYMVSILVFVAIYYPQYSTFMLFFIYGFIPMLDELVSLDERNPTQQERKYLEKQDFLFRIPLYIHIITDWVCFFIMLRYFQRFQLGTTNLIQFAAITFVFMTIFAGQFTVSHQIFHRNDTFHRILGTLHMLKNMNMHFTYNHLFIHHRRVATPQDPASAEKGITIYQFFPQSIIGGYKAVYLSQKEQNIPFYLNYAILSISQAMLFSFLIGFVFGIQTMLFFLLSAFVSNVFLEYINYIEHYGLRRKKLQDGTYEKTTAAHSWNAPHRLSNYFLFKLQRHSDHHQNSMKPYQTLSSIPSSPVLPHGYSVLTILCFLPQRFFQIMDPLVQIQYGNKSEEQKQQIFEKSKFLARKFVVELFLTTGAISFISCIFK